jgi:4-hydroxy-tetrahydrodipicolinate reductase
MKLSIIGASGRVGQEILKLLPIYPQFSLQYAVVSQENNLNGKLLNQALHCEYFNYLAFTSNLEKALEVDVVIDFSTPQTLLDILKKLPHGTALFSGTTGYENEVIEKILSLNNSNKICLASNTSLGIALLQKFLLQHSKTLKNAGFDIEINETHHKMKKDTPSGTALTLASVINDSCHQKLNIRTDNYHNSERKDSDLQITSQRCGGIVGQHSVRFVSQNEEVIISHNAYNRSLFACGALQMAENLFKQDKNGIYETVDLL